MKIVALLALFSTIAQAQLPEFCYRTSRGSGCYRTDRAGPSLAFFEFAPESGAGMPAVCSTTAPTGAKGEVLTFTRATTATCQATGAGGMVSSGIANGDLSTVASGVVRVEYNRNGVKGVRVESARTASDLRTQEIDNVAWTTGASGVAVPTRTADFAVAPDGTTTAERVQIPLTTAAQYSYVIQSGYGAASWVNSLYVKGNSTPGTMHLLLGTSPNACVLCSFVSSSWTRCSLAYSPTVGALIGFGNDSANAACVSAGSAASALDVLVWGAPAETGGFATSYIATTSAAVTRNADVVSLPVTLSGTAFSAAISYDAPSALVSGATAFQIYVDANNSVTAALDGSSHVTCTFRIGGSDSTVTSTATLTASAVNRVACTYGASGRSACVGGACTTTAGALTMPTGAATFYVGTRSATGNESNGVMSQGCYDPSATRCR